MFIIVTQFQKTNYKISKINSVTPCTWLKIWRKKNSIRKIQVFCISISLHSTLLSVMCHKMCTIGGKKMHINQFHWECGWKVIFFGSMERVFFFHIISGDILRQNLLENMMWAVNVSNWIAFNFLSSITQTNCSFDAMAWC